MDRKRKMKRKRRVGAVSWRLRTVSWNEFCWINKFHYKNTLALSRGWYQSVRSIRVYLCLQIDIHERTRAPPLPTPGMYLPPVDYVCTNRIVATSISRWVDLIPEADTIHFQYISRNDLGVNHIFDSSSFFTR